MGEKAAAIPAMMLLTPTTFLVSASLKAHVRNGTSLALVSGVVQEHAPAEGPKINVVNLCVLLIGTGKGIRHVNKICHGLERAKGDSETFAAASIKWGSFDASDGARTPRTMRASYLDFPCNYPIYTCHRRDRRRDGPKPIPHPFGGIKLAVRPILHTYCA
ncbi:hypothetical protein BDW60DRAFT_207463 [Aspergillus nidulans var. acristatus]